MMNESGDIIKERATFAKFLKLGVKTYETLSIVRVCEDFVMNN